MPAVTPKVKKLRASTVGALKDLLDSGYSFKSAYIALNPKMSFGSFMVLAKKNGLKENR